MVAVWLLVRRLLWVQRRCHLAVPAKEVGWSTQQLSINPAITSCHRQMQWHRHGFACQPEH